jgi:hypothetical protein
LVELAQTADVIDVGVSTDYGFDGKLVAAKKVEDAVDFVPGIDNESFASDGVADDRAIALQHADGDGDVNQSILRSAERGQAVKHGRDYSIGERRARRKCRMLLRHTLLD